MMTEFNPINLKQGASLPSVPDKLRKENTGGGPGQPILFACIMGNACRITTQKTEKNPLNFRSGKGKIGGRSSKGNAIRRSGAFNIDPENNILSAGKDKTEKTNQSLPVVKGKCLVKSLHRAIPGSEATKNINVAARNSKGDFPRLFEDASKGKSAKANGSIIDKINLLPEEDGQKQIKGKVENLPRSIGLKKSEAGINNALMEDATGQMKQGLNKQSIKSGLSKSGLMGVIAGKDEALKKSMGARVADPVGENFRTGKTAIAVSKNGGLKESREGRNSHRAEVAIGPLKFSQKKAADVKGNDSSKNYIKGPPRHSGLKGGETVGEHEKTGIEKFPDHKMEVLFKVISSPLHSIDKVASAGAYHHASFHSGGCSEVVNESVNSRGIEPQVLINQIASGVKRSGRVRITLNPPRLGTLDVNVLVRDNKVHVMLLPENNDVRHILQSNVESLRSSLRNHGLVADTINVSVQEKSDGANYKSGQNETLFKEGGNREGNEENQRGGQDFLNRDPTLLEKENQRVRSDERVSLFA
ncbi:MAG: flagellar hook-length control protein FliK [Deltaproteobacteria bacterium]|nr:flagellar hook-length control protein FliK [Deltaproteobacteria bacterium]